MSKENELPSAVTRVQNMNGFVHKECLSEQAGNSATIDSKVLEAWFSTVVERSCNCKSSVTLEGIILIAICTLVALGFCVPIVIYAVDTDHGNTPAIPDFKFTSNCTDGTRQVGSYHN